MTDNNKRRALLKSARTATGILALSESSTWIKPVVEVVMLPAHAQTTPAQGQTNQGTGPVNSPPVARLDGVVDGLINTQFIADAGASSDPDGDSLTYVFSVSGACSLDSQSGALATINRRLISGTCTVTVVVGDGALTDSTSASAQVTGGPPGPP